jgi:hypothetical protein
MIMKESTASSLNPNEPLKRKVSLDGYEWVAENTAILVVHGIGDQLPLETLDQFGRGLAEQFKVKFGNDITLTHETFTKPGGNGDVWFDNVLRVRKYGSDHFIDIYEYYWANYTEDKATWTDINKWLQGVIKGANSFYEKNGKIGTEYKDKSPFFDSKTGKFKVGRYRRFLSAIANFFFIVSSVREGLLWLVNRIPFLGKFAGRMLESYSANKAHEMANVIGDIAVYNVVDPKSKFYGVRRQILDGAVKAVKYLIEKQANEAIDINILQEMDKEGTKQLPKEAKLYYPSVLIAGHSLGSQVSYDAINKINLLVNKGEIKNYNPDGTCIMHGNRKISEQLRGYITFGSPLDKIVFFLRENVSDKEYIRQQFLNHYHGFKLRDLDKLPESENGRFIKANSNLVRLMDEIPWRNYYDHKDYVSGGLDYYTNLTNVNCQYKAGWLGFTHSNYWTDDDFFVDIIINFLNGDSRGQKVEKSSHMTASNG